MSTRANVLIKDEYSEQWFYRHQDGYPSVTTKSLKTFVEWTNSGKLRSNVIQGGSWLIVIGNNEYEIGSEPEGGWKVGAYEITNKQHFDIEYLYTIDLHKKTIQIDDIHNDKAISFSFEEFLKLNFD